jgi:hypothetical protein
MATLYCSKLYTNNDIINELYISFMSRLYNILRGNNYIEEVLCSLVKPCIFHIRQFRSGICSGMVSGQRDRLCYGTFHGNAGKHTSAGRTRSFYRAVHRPVGPQENHDLQRPHHSAADAGADRFILYRRYSNLAYLRYPGRQVRDSNTNALNRRGKSLLISPIPVEVSYTFEV